MTRATLLVIQGPDQGARFPLADGAVSIGRGVQNDVRLRDTEVSRRHARIFRRGDEFVLEDLNSSNGTFVNGQEVRQCVLRGGEELQFGCSKVLFDRVDDDASGDLIAANIHLIDSGVIPDASQIVGQVTPTAGVDVLSPETAADSQIAQTVTNLQVLYQITEAAVTPTISLDQLLNRILDMTIEVVGADRGCVLLKHVASGELRPQAYRVKQGAKPGGRMPVSRSIVQYVLRTRQGVRTRDARQDSRFDTTGSILRAGIREAMCVPMQGRYELNGVIYLDTTSKSGPAGERSAVAALNETQFNEDKLRLLVAIARQAALAIEDHRFRDAYVTAERLAAVGQTIAVLSHHIKNILQGIRGGGHLIDMGLKQHSEDLVQHGWQIVEKNQDKIYNLVMDMLSFSKERKPELRPADLNETVGDVCELVRARAEEAGVRLECNNTAVIPRSMFDPDALHRAVLNVVLNAVEAVEGREDACVRVETGFREEHDELFVSVTDNGPGISDEVRSRLFNLFESSKGARGTGIGLAVSQKIIREHGGEIHVTSRPGVATQFVMCWPRIEDDSITQTEPTA